MSKTYNALCIPDKEPAGLLIIQHSIYHITNNNSVSLHCSVHKNISILTLNMNSIKRIYIWLSRISHCRGFGVQSPSAYRFIRYVISEHYPYYAYADLAKEYAGVDWLTRKKMEFYFRLANFRQPNVVSNVMCAANSNDCSRSDDSNIFKKYVERGCRKSKLVNVSADIAHDDALLTDVLGNAPVELLRITSQSCSDALLLAVLRHTDAKSIVVVEDIGSDQRAMHLWQKLQESDLVSVSYDMYYLGVAFFDTKRIKANYIVNF